MSGVRRTLRKDTKNITAAHAKQPSTIAPSPSGGSGCERPLKGRRQVPVVTPSRHKQGEDLDLVSLVFGTLLPAIPAEDDGLVSYYEVSVCRRTRPPSVGWGHWVKEKGCGKGWK